MDEACWDACAVVVVVVVVVIIVLLVELLRLAWAARPADCISCADLRLIGRACTAWIAVAILTFSSSSSLRKALVFGIISVIFSLLKIFLKKVIIIQGGLLTCVSAQDTDFWGS